MTNGVQSARVSNLYAQNSAKKEQTKEAQTKQERQEVSNQTKLDEIREKIESGRYKIDVDKLAEKMAEELLS